MKICANRLFEHLVDMTAIRDMELLEFSLLQTINRYMQPQELRLLRIDNKFKIRNEIVYCKDTCSIVDPNHDLDEDTLRVIELMQDSEAVEHTHQTDDGFISFFEIMNSNHRVIYIKIMNTHSISRQNRNLLLGLIEIFKNYVHLLIENNTDSLTGLLNRKSFEVSIDKIYDLIPSLSEEEDEESNVTRIEKREVEKNQYWLAMIDIDHFKSINDKFGHLYGDDVLILLSNLLKSSFRQDDLIFRFGGEEFVLILSCKDMENARNVLENFLLKVSRFRFPQVGQVTVSAGCIQIDNYTYYGTLLDRADIALYHCKETGRNCVTFFEDMVEQGLIHLVEEQTGEIELFDPEADDSTTA